MNRRGRGNYTIGEFARLSGLNPRTIDFYTRQGLLYPQQAGKNHGYRHYTEDDRRRVSLIKQLQAQKLSLREIRRILHLGGKKSGPTTLGAMERVSLDLEKLQKLIEETRSLTPLLDQRAIRALANKALQRATALCSMLATVLQDVPPL